MARRQRAGLGLVALVAAVAGLFACSGGGGKTAGSSSSATTAPFTQQPGSASCADVSGGGGGGGSGGGGGGTVPSGPATGDPFDAAGARQRVGPSTTTTLIPSSPVSIIVAVPPNPDLDVPAARPDPAVSVDDPTLPPIPEEPPVEGQSAGAPVVVALPAGSTPTTWPVSSITVPFCGAGDSGGDP